MLLTPHILQGKSKIRNKSSLTRNPDDFRSQFYVYRFLIYVVLFATESQKGALTHTIRFEDIVMLNNKLHHIQRLLLEAMEIHKQWKNVNNVYDSRSC